MSLSLLILALGCSGSQDVSTEPEQAISAELIAASWQVEVAAPGKLDELLQNPAWGQIYERQFGASIPAFGSEVARGHAEAAAIYRQAALLQASAIMATFGPEDRRETDPAQVDYLVGVAAVMQGDLEAAREHLCLPPPESDHVEAVADADAAWCQALAAEDFTLDQAPALFEMSEVVAGTLPDLPTAPHYKLPEPESGLVVEVADPTMAWQVALWHEEAARQAGGEAWLDAWLAPWRLPLEPVVETEASELPLDALFLGPWATDGDLAFINAMETDHTAAMETFKGSSGYAAVLQVCSQEEEVDVDCLLDQSVALGAQLEDAMAEAYGSQHVDHRVFASFARAGLLRAGARLCDARGQERTAVILRLNARDRGAGAATDPKFLISLAAWDAGKRNALRATELFHPNRNAVPGLDAVRVSLDAFGLRVGREFGPDIPK